MSTNVLIRPANFRSIAFVFPERSGEICIILTLDLHDSIASFILEN